MGVSGFLPMEGGFITTFVLFTWSVFCSRLEGAVCVWDVGWVISGCWFAIGTISQVCFPKGFWISGISLCLNRGCSCVGGSWFWGGLRRRC